MGSAVLILVIACVNLASLLLSRGAARSHETGIRRALGADPRRVMIDVVRAGLAVTLAGVSVGFVAALLAVQFVRSLLFGITPHDPVALLAALAFPMITATVACWLPARRGARVDPILASRADYRARSPTTT